MTLEEAQARILELEDTVSAITNEKETLLQNNESLSAELESVRKLNQQYFNKLSAQYLPPEDKTNNEETEVPTCEDFAKTLTIL